MPPPTPPHTTTPNPAADVNVKNFRRGYAMWHLVTSSPELVDLLLGDTPLPSGRYSDQTLGSSSFMAAVTYVASNRDLWEAVPGALQHLRRYRNTAEAHFLGQDLRRGHPFDMERFRHYLADGGGGGMRRAGGGECFACGRLNCRWGAVLCCTSRAALVVACRLVPADMLMWHMLGRMAMRAPRVAMLVGLASRLLLRPAGPWPLVHL
jgi:hypothetical protein